MDVWHSYPRNVSRPHLRCHCRSMPRYLFDRDGKKKRIDFFPFLFLYRADAISFRVFSLFFLLSSSNNAEQARILDELVKYLITISNINNWERLLEIYRRFFFSEHDSVISNNNLLPCSPVFSRILEKRIPPINSFTQTNSISTTKRKLKRLFLPRNCLSITRCSLEFSKSTRTDEVFSMVVSRVRT